MPRTQHRKNMQTDMMMKRTLLLLGLTLGLHTTLTHAQTGDMLKSVYDPQNAGYISGLSTTATGGVLNMDAGPGALSSAGDILTYGGLNTPGGHIWMFGSNTARSGSIEMYGGSTNSANGGNLLTNGGTGYAATGGDVMTAGGSGSFASGGRIDMRGGNLSGAVGGSIITAGSATGGGSIYTYGWQGGAGGMISTRGGDNGFGGSIITEDGGGRIDTRYTGFIGFGSYGTRTNLTGSATADRLQYFPDRDGTLATVEDIEEREPTKAWVNFDGTTNDNEAATYGRSGTTVTVNLSNHGHIVGHVVQIDFTSGGALDGTYTVASVIDANNFTVTTAASGTIASGNTLSLLRSTIRASEGIHSVTHTTTGGYRVNFSPALPDADYALALTASSVGSYRFVLSGLVANTAESIQLGACTTAFAAADASTVSVTVTR